MLDEREVEKMIHKLRERAQEDPAVASDVLEVLAASYGSDRDEPAAEIAKTVCEILEPARVGPLLWLTCKNCNVRLETDEEKERGSCTSCLVGP
jgi:hypothetical protein